MTIRDEDLELLRVASGTAVGKELPKSLVDTYLEYKRILDRCSVNRVPFDILVQIVYASGHASPTPEDREKFDIVKLASEGKVKKGDKLEIYWRDERMSATFECITPRQRVKLMVGEETETRELDPKVVLKVVK